MATFSDALEAMKEGAKVRRTAWFDPQAYMFIRDGEILLFTDGVTHDMFEYTACLSRQILKDDWRIIEL